MKKKKRPVRVLDNVVKPKVDEVKSSICQASFITSALKTGGLVAVYYTFSIFLTFYNQRFVRHFRYPLSLTVAHLCFKFISASLIRWVLECRTGKHRIMLPWGMYIKRVAPPGIASALDIGLSNWSLEFITISLYTMCKSSVVIFILGFSILFKLEKCRLSLVFVVIFIASGLLMFTYHSTQFHLVGFIIVMIASFLSGIRWTMTQILTQNKEIGLSHPLDVMYHMQPWMIIGLLPLAAPFEGMQIATTDQFFRFSNNEVLARNIGLVLIGAVLAFFLEFSEFLLLRCTSSLTLSICGICKEIILLYLSAKINKDTMNVVNGIGLCVCLIGITIHVILKALNKDSTKPSKNRLSKEAIEMLTKDGDPNASDESEEDIFNVRTDR